MTEVAAIGRPSEVAGFALAGVLVRPARSVAEAISAWRSLPETVCVVILTQESARALAEEQTRPRAPLTVVMPP
jgi:vacuolar-type H+-ATPase subunit F/Vma7